LILLGDLNASPLRFGPLAQVQIWASRPFHRNEHEYDAFKCYDNIVFDRYATNGQNKFGVFDIASYYKLTTEQRIGFDHQPIWGLFSAYESHRPECVAADGIR
jgi:hypothetical protein